MFKFSIKIDDDEHSLSSEDGIPFDKLAELLKTLFPAIDPHTGTKCTLGKIRGNCYAIDFFSADEKYLSNFVIVHKNVEQVNIEELDKEQKEYAITLRKILGGKYYLKAFDNSNSEIATIKDLGKKTSVEYYYSNETVYGILSMLGSQAILDTKKYIYLDGIANRITISKVQDLELKPYYGTNKLRLKIRNKRSAYDGHVISSEMVSFTVVGENDIMDNLKNVGYIDFELIKRGKTLDDIVKSIYEGRE